MKRTAKQYPWTPGTEFLFKITDMSVPDDPEAFKALIGWIAGRIEAGEKVHVGCIGGHGRTGMVLAALVKVMTGEEDAIAHVRKHYCDKAVETAAQADFLAKHFGIKKVGGSKAQLGTWQPTISSGLGKAKQTVGEPTGDLFEAQIAKPRRTVEVSPVKIRGSLWDE